MLSYGPFLHILIGLYHAYEIVVSHADGIKCVARKWELNNRYKTKKCISRMWNGSKGIHKIFFFGRKKANASHADGMPLPRFVVLGKKEFDGYAEMLV